MLLERGGVRATRVDGEGARQTVDSWWALAVVRAGAAGLGGSPGWGTSAWGASGHAKKTRSGGAPGLELLPQLDSNQ